MRTTSPGRHRAPSTTAASLTRLSATAVASSGLVLSMAAGAQAAPAAAPAAPTAPATAPASAPAVVSTPVTAPNVVLPTDRWQTVAYGQRGNMVRKVQRIVGTSVDGHFGPLTDAAVKRWQGRNGLVRDGRVGPLTSAKMGLRSSSRESSAPSRSNRSSDVNISNANSSNADSNSNNSYSNSYSNNSNANSSNANSNSYSSNANSNSILSQAQRYTGIYYSWGGSTPAGFDCSGYTQYVFAQAGISIPRTAEAQRRAATPVSNPQPGDLVFYGSPAWHVGIYAGGGQMYDSGKPGLQSQKRNVFSGVSMYGRVG